MRIRVQCAIGLVLASFFAACSPPSATAPVATEPGVSLTAIARTKYLRLQGGDAVSWSDPRPEVPLLMAGSLPEGLTLENRKVHRATLEQQGDGDQPGWGPPLPAFEVSDHSVLEALCDGKHAMTAGGRGGETFIMLAPPYSNSGDSWELRDVKLDGNSIILEVDGRESSELGAAAKIFSLRGAKLFSLGHLAEGRYLVAVVCRHLKEDGHGYRYDGQAQSAGGELLVTVNGEGKGLVLSLKELADLPMELDTKGLPLIVTPAYWSRELPLDDPAALASVTAGALDAYTLMGHFGQWDNPRKTPVPEAKTNKPDPEYYAVITSPLLRDDEWMDLRPTQLVDGSCDITVDLWMNPSANEPAEKHRGFFLVPLYFLGNGDNTVKVNWRVFDSHDGGQSYELSKTPPYPPAVTRINVR